MNKNIRFNIINFIWFQTIWWLLIVYQSSAILAVMVLFVVWLLVSPSRRLDSALMISVMLLGTTVDSLLLIAGVFIFDDSQGLTTVGLHWLIPLWLTLLWGAFAATLEHSLANLKNSLLLAAIVGGMFAPLSYLGGAKLGAVDLGYAISTTYIVLGAIWAVTLPMCFVLAKRLRAHVEPANLKGDEV